jgi:hypothetical protein
MLRILRAFAWMRWRVLVNSLERTTARDTMERLSLAVEQIGPFIVAALFIPSALALAGLAAYTGYALASGTGELLPFAILRYLFLAASLLSVFGPIIFPASERTNAVRLLLLPIPRRVLYIAQAAGTVSDPWILLLLPVVLALPVGLAAGGAIGAGIVGLMAGVLVTVVLIGLSSATTMVLQIVVRNRRRAELFALLFILILPMLGLLPGLMDAQRRREGPEGRATGDANLPGWIREGGRRAVALAPSELFASAIRSGTAHDVTGSTSHVAGLLAEAVVLHGFGVLAFGRLLDSPPSAGPRRATASAAVWGIKLPGLSRGASAVALTQVRLALRTPRGRSILLSPLLVFSMFALIMWRSGSGMEFGFITLKSGIALATFGSAVGLISILPFAMNQFAIDRAGLTLTLLSPLRDSELLAGKAVGNGIIAGMPSLLCLMIAFVLFPQGSPALWVSIPLGLASTYFLAAPAAAALSAILPRAVDLNSIGRGSNAHGLAGLLGLAAFLAAGAPAIGLTLSATRLLDRAGLAPVLLLLWCAVAFAISRLLFVPARMLFGKRRENLGLTV